jgi:hypothetical protein
MLVERALPGDGGCIGFAEDDANVGNVWCVGLGLLSSSRPRSAPIDIPAERLLGKSLVLLYGELLGGPREAEERCIDDALEDCVGEGGGIERCE